MSTTRGTAAFPLQRELFSRSEVAEWLPPPKPRKSTPEDLLRLIVRMTQEGRKCFASVSWFAGKLGACVRTIQRWIKQLGSRIEVAANTDTRTRQYRPTAIFTAPAVQKLSPQTCTPPRPHLYMNPSGNTSKKKLAASFEMPQPTIRHAAGRVEANPAWSAVQTFLRGALERIRGAKNPTAYEQAILRREFPQHWRVA